MLEENVVYQKDNLELMKTIPDSSIDLIYNDVLFGTNHHFNDFDDYFKSMHAVIEFYYPRFLEMHRVLKDSGLVYIHCDYHLCAYIKMMLDKVFGINNFRNEIVWWYNSAPRKKNDFGKRHDDILRYSKTDSYYFNKDSRYIRQSYSLTAPRGYEKEKYYDVRGKIMDDVWKIPMIGQNNKKERVGYSTQKPLKLLYPVIDSSCPVNGIVADFFCGSGTTLVAAKKLGRKYIGCDTSEKAVNISKDRLTLCKQK